MNLIILSIHREVNAMEYKYENYGISDLLGHKTSIFGEGINTAMPVIPTEKFMNNLVQKISLTKNVKVLTKQDLADLDAKRFVEPDKLLIEGLFGNNRPYQLYKMEDYQISKVAIEMFTRLEYNEGVDCLDREIKELKRSYTLMEPKLINALFTQQDEFGMHTKNTDELRKKCRLDQVLYIPESQKNYSYCRFAYNYDNIHNKIDQNNFNGLAIFISIWLRKGIFYAYQFSMSRTYRSDEFSN